MSFLLPILIFAAGNIHAQLVTNGSFENTMPGPVTGNDIEGWVFELVPGLVEISVEKENGDE